jgi:hypothetical protein
MISKSDFLLYCDAPRHLWAKKHGMIEQSISEFDQHLAEEGNRVEALAQEYLSSVWIHHQPGKELEWQQTYTDGQFEARLDALVYKAHTSTYDLYEIKSSTSVDKDIVYDVTFQAVILEKHIHVDHYYVLHLNKDYIRSGDLELSALYVAEDITEKVSALKPEVVLLRGEALRIAQLKDPEESEHCLAPKDCPCPEICHPDLPEFSIYDIPRLNRVKKLQLLENGIRAAEDIPESFDLNPKQRLVMNMAKTGQEHVDPKGITVELEKMSYPIWFLDYETCICAIPQFDGYHPQQQIVFQYSLHRLEKSRGELQHMGHIAITPGDPSLSILEHLSADLNSEGTIIVWNKSFEMTMNRDMAIVHPEFALFLEDLNKRIYDLGELINQGMYLHPGFKGSWSIKNVLPVMVKELTYEGLAIGKGDQASMAWWNMTFGHLDEQEKEDLTEALMHYCELDTLAMVEIFKRIQTLA